MKSKQIIANVISTCTVFLVSQQFVSLITLAFHPFRAQEIDVAIEVTFSKQTIPGVLNTCLGTSTVVVAAQLRILCCKYITKIKKQERS